MIDPSKALVAIAEAERARLCEATAASRACAAIVVLALFVLAALQACGNLFQDNGTHLAYALERGARELKGSGRSEISVHYATLDSPDEPYYVEITPSLRPGQASGTWGSYLVVSGKSSGGTSYHNRFVYVPQRLYLNKDHGGAVDVVLQRDGDRISIVELR